MHPGRRKNSNNACEQDEQISAQSAWLMVHTKICLRYRRKYNKFSFSFHFLCYFSLTLTYFDWTILLLICCCCSEMLNTCRHNICCLVFYCIWYFYSISRFWWCSCHTTSFEEDDNDSSQLDNYWGWKAWSFFNFSPFRLLTVKCLQLRLWRELLYLSGKCVTRGWCINLDCN